MQVHAGHVAQKGGARKIDIGTVELTPAWPGRYASTDQGGKQSSVQCQARKTDGSLNVLSSSIEGGAAGTAPGEYKS